MTNTMMNLNDSHNM